MHYEVVASHTYPALNTPIRVITIDGTEWFPAKDVCDALSINNPRQAVPTACVPDEFMHVLKSTVISNDVSFPNRGMLCVNESGLNALVFNSRKPEARAFRQWVTGTVLPAIRKDGMYVVGEEKLATGEMDDDTLIAKAMEALQRKSIRLAQERDAALSDLAEARVEIDRVNSLGDTQGQPTAQQPTEKLKAPRT